MHNDKRHNSIISEIGSAVRIGTTLFILFKSLDQASQIVQSILDILCRLIWRGILFLKGRFGKGAAAPVGYITDSSQINVVENAIRNLPAGDQLSIMREIEAFWKRKGL